MTRTNFAHLASIPWRIFVDGGLGYAAPRPPASGMPMGFMKFSRGFEEDADYWACNTCSRRDTALSRFRSSSRRSGLWKSESRAPCPRCLPLILRTRVKSPEIQAQTDKQLPPRLHYVVSTSEFDDVKTRIAILESRGRVTNQSVEAKPTVAQSGKDDESRSGEDRPTLTRRETG